MNFQCACNFEKRCDCGHPFSPLNFAVMCAVKIGQTADHFLRKISLFPVFLNDLPNQFCVDVHNITSCKKFTKV